MFENITVIGAGNGGKAAAADLALRGRRVRLFEFAEYAANLREVMNDRRLSASGAFSGEAQLEMVSTDLRQAVHETELIIVCTQAPAHRRVAEALVRLVRPRQTILLNPGSTGGSLVFAHVFHEAGMKQLPLLAETSTLTYGCRATGSTVRVSLRVRRVTYGVFPGNQADRVGAALEELFPGLVRGQSVLEAGLKNANPVIHPPIALLNAGRIENQGSNMLFYQDGVSPTVAAMIRRLDEERQGLLRAMGYSAPSDPETCVAQGYAESSGYFECYARGSTFQGFRAPDTLDHRYFHEDLGVGLVMFCSLGRALGVATPACKAFVRLGGLLHGRDYFAEAARTLEGMGLGGMGAEGLRQFLETGRQSI